jgi:hypothetical protein
MTASPEAEEELSMYTLEVLNPVAQQRGALTAMAINSRPASLANKTLGLLWSGTHGGDVALKRAGEMLQERFANLTVNFYAGSGYPITPSIVKRAAEECDVVIGATAD